MLRAVDRDMVVCCMSVLRVRIVSSLWALEVQEGFRSDAVMCVGSWFDVVAREPSCSGVAASV